MSPLDLMPFRVLLDRIVVPARRHVREMFWPVATPLAICGVVLAAAQWVWMDQLQGAMMTPTGDMTGLFGGCAVFVLIAVGTLGVYAVTYGALLSGAMQVVEGAERVDMGKAWAFALRTATAGTILLVAAIVFLSFMMCVLPGFYFAPALGFVLPIMAHEKRFGLDALRRNFELLKHNPTGRWSHHPWVQMAVLMGVGLVLNYSITITAQLPFLILQQVMFSRKAIEGQLVGDPAELMSDVLWLQVPANLVGALATALTWMYWAFGQALLYWELRRRREGWDLDAAITEILEPGQALRDGALGGSLSA